ncbi:MAG: hypothetical protein E7016_01770 [Alphaproteobacteria bacterium]|nr:hypothetical protein [Alphaproteobacteria bacterium]
MNRLLELIAKSDVCHKENALKSVDIIRTQKDLVKMGCPFLPVEFIDFLKHYNGVSASDCAILGVPPLEDDRLNIVEFNKQYNSSTNMAILGYDDSAFLVYDNNENLYKLLDRADLVLLDEYAPDEIVYALNSILHI